MEETHILDKIKPRIGIVSYTVNAPELIASSGKSTLTPREINDILESMSREKIVKWIKELFRRGHGSPLEHGVYTFEVICSRVASHQIVRHRIASYTQLSQRYSDKYLREMIASAAKYVGIETPSKPRSRRDYLTYVDILEKLLGRDPEFYELLSIVGEAFIIPPSIIGKEDKFFLVDLVKNTIRYYKLLLNGYSFEDSRYILPQAVKTRLLITMNTRELLESFLNLRMCIRAQWEIRYIAWKLWERLVKIHPEIFMYAGPRCVFMDNRVRNELCRLVDYLNDRCKPVIQRCPELVPSDQVIDCLKNASRDPWLVLNH